MAPKNVSQRHNDGSCVLKHGLRRMESDRNSFGGVRNQGISTKIKSDVGQFDRHELMIGVARGGQPAYAVTEKLDAAECYWHRTLDGRRTLWQRAPLLRSTTCAIGGLLDFLA